MLNAVATANGFTYRANKSRVFIKRADGQKEEEFPLTGMTQVAPGDIDSYLALERVLVQETKIQEAIAVLDKLVSVDPKSARPERSGWRTSTGQAAQAPRCLKKNARFETTAQISASRMPSSRVMKREWRRIRLVAGQVPW